MLYARHHIIWYVQTHTYTRCSACKFQALARSSHPPKSKVSQPNQSRPSDRPTDRPTKATTTTIITTQTSPPGRQRMRAHPYAQSARCKQSLSVFFAFASMLCLVCFTYAHGYAKVCVQHTSICIYVGICMQSFANKSKNMHQPAQPASQPASTTIPNYSNNNDNNKQLHSAQSKAHVQHARKYTRTRETAARHSARTDD